MAPDRATTPTAGWNAAVEFIQTCIAGYDDAVDIEAGIIARVGTMDGQRIVHGGDLIVASLIMLASIRDAAGDEDGTLSCSLQELMWGYRYMDTTNPHRQVPVLLDDVATQACLEELVGASGQATTRERASLGGRTIHALHTQVRELLAGPLSTPEQATRFGWYLLRRVRLFQMSFSSQLLLEQVAAVVLSRQPR